MAIIKFSNNASTTLAANISNSATSLTLAAGDGAEFPSLGTDEYFMITVIDDSNNMEIMKCTARTSDTLTVVRAQEGTSARAFNVGSYVENRLTADSLTKVSNVDAFSQAAEASKIAAESAEANAKTYSENASLIGMDIGTLFQHAGITPPLGAIAQIGGTSSRAAFPEFWTWIQQQTGWIITEVEWQAKAAAVGPDGDVPYFSSGDGSTTFRNMRLLNFGRGSLNTTASDGILDSAPNIDGSVGVIPRMAAVSSTGALSLSPYGSTPPYPGTPGTHPGDNVRLQIDAAASSDAYGRSNEVAPKHFKATWYIKAANSVINQSTIDASQLQSQIDTITGTTIPDSTLPKLGIDKYARFSDTKQVGISGGTFTSGSWITRTLNTEEFNSITGCTLNPSTSRITLPAGNYYIRAVAPAYAVEQTRAALYNNATSSMLARSTSVYAWIQGVNTVLSINTLITLAETSEIELRHKCTSTKTTNGLGVATGMVDEKYAEIEIWKVS